MYQYKQNDKIFNGRCNLHLDSWVTTTTFFDHISLTLVDMVEVEMYLKMCFTNRQIILLVGFKILYKKFKCVLKTPKQ